MPYVNPRIALKTYGVCTRTLQRWADGGKIDSIRTKLGHRRFWIDGEVVKEKTKVTDRQVQPTKEKIKIAYCRVSSSKQKDDLARQSACLSDKYPGHRIVTDIGSGLNFKRKGLLSVLELVSRGGVQEIVVASKDRLCRFAFDLIAWLCDQNDVQLVVLDKSDKSPNEEFTEDILAIMQVFSCRWNGKRRYNKKIKSTEIADIPIPTSEGDIPEDCGMHTENLQQSD